MQRLPVKQRMFVTWTWRFTVRVCDVGVHADSGVRRDPSVLARARRARYVLEGDDRGRAEVGAGRYSCAYAMLAAMRTLAWNAIVLSLRERDVRVRLFTLNRAAALEFVCADRAARTRRGGNAQAGQWRDRSVLACVRRARDVLDSVDGGRLGVSLLGSSCAYATLGAMRTPASAAIVLSLRARGVRAMSLKLVTSAAWKFVRAGRLARTRT